MANLVKGLHTDYAIYVFFYYYWVDTSAGELLVSEGNIHPVDRVSEPLLSEGNIHPVVSASILACLIRYIY